MEINCKGQVVLLTGGSRGIGKAIAEAFGRTQATVAVHYNQNKGIAEEIAQSLGNNSQAFQADLSDLGTVPSLVDSVYKAYGKIDTLVNNAAVSISEPEVGAFEAWASAWEQTLRVNLMAPAALSRGCIPLFKKQGGGRIVHIASRAAFRGDEPSYGAYAASKGGMVAYSRSLARAYGKFNIKSFVIAPGFTRTEMAQQFIEEFGEEIAMKDFALDRLTEPGDVAPTAVFLASGFMDHATGCTIDINGGSYVH